MTALPEKPEPSLILVKDIPQPDPERLALLRSSLTVTSAAEAKDRGLTDDELLQLCGDVSGLIDRYVGQHHGEMLPKAPEVVLDQLKKGLSCLIFTKKDGIYIPLHHSSIYPMFEEGEEEILGIQLVE